MVSLPVRFDVDDVRLARMAWSRLAEPLDLAAFRFVAEVGHSAAVRAVLTGGAPAPRWAVRAATLDPVRDLEQLRRSGGRVVVPEDDEWPAGLDDLGEATPHCLYARGPRRLDEVATRAVAVVGCRAATPYGEHVAAQLAGGCAEAGVAVVSGAAYGIDGVAHRAALAAGGASPAVLACGVDRAYPAGHRPLIEALARNHVVVSEVPAGSSPTRLRFLERNRLIAALSSVTVVVEAAHRSGALGTAARAERIGRTVAAVPGPVTSPASAGCHALLRVGAVCVTDAAEVLELLAPMGESLVPAASGRTEPFDGLPPQDLAVLDALPLRRAAEIRAVCTTAGLSLDVVEPSLGRLQLAGLAEEVASGRWRRAGR